MPDPDTPRNPGWRLGRFAGIPIFVAPSWLIIAIVLLVLYAPVVSHRLPELSATGSYVISGVFVITLFASVLAHELGHAVVAQRLGVPVRSMTLWMLGGMTEMTREPRRPSHEFAIAAAGPAVSLGLGVLGVAAAAVAPSGVWNELAVQLAFSNLALTVFNLLPGIPLDGGSLVRAVVWGLGADRLRATIVAGWSGRVVAAVVLLFGIFLAWQGRDGGGASTTSLLFTGAVCMFMWLAASAAIRTAQAQRRIPRLALRSLLRPAVAVPAALPLAEALRRATELQRSAIVIVDDSGGPTAVVSQAAVAAMPLARRPWVEAGAVARAVASGMILPAELTGAAVIEAMRATPADEYVVVSGDDVLGVLLAADVAAALKA